MSLVSRMRARPLASRTRAVRTGLAAIAFGLGALGPARALDIGPKDLPLTVAGVPVAIPVSGSLDVHTTASDIAIAASATGNLQAIQDHALEIARGLRLPHDACAHKGVSVVVNSVDAAAITPAGSSVVVELSGHVTVWACKKILGAALKTQIASDSVTIAAPVELYLPNPQTIALRLTGPATIKTGDPLTEEAASLFVGDVNAALNAQLSKLLDARRAQAMAPPMPGLDLTLEDAAFVQRGDSLTVRARGRARLTSEAFANLMAFFAH